MIKKVISVFFTFVILSACGTEICNKKYDEDRKQCICEESNFEENWGNLDG